MTFGLCAEGPFSSPLSHPEGVPEVPLTPEAVSVELRPLILWMANTTELLSYVQEKVLEMEKEADQEGELGPGLTLARCHALCLET